jgi:PAS domain S-box-containing protein
MEKISSRVAPYGVAVVSVGVGVALPLVTKPFIGQSAPWVSFIPAVTLSAWYGGFVPGLITTGLLIVSTLALQDVLFTSATSSASRGFAGLMFLIAAFAVCLAIRAMRLAQAAAMEAASGAQAAELRAQAERDRLDVIVRDLPVGVVIATADGKVELANPAAIDIHGAALRPGDDLPLCQPISIRTPSGQELDPAHWPIERALRHDETVVNEELDIFGPDGATRALMINARPLQNSTALATYSDVTSLRETQKALRGSEARLRRLFDSNIIGVVSGEDDVALEANDGFLQLLGFSRSDLKNREIVFSRLTPEKFRSADSRATSQMAERGFSDPYDKELLTADGRSVPVMVGAISFEAGKSSPWMAWVLDLSEHRRLEERLRQAAKAESIGLLAGGVAHDFNNLLTIIIGNATMAQMALPEGSGTRAQIDNAVRAAERAADLTRQLLAYAGKGRFVVRDADVSATVREIATLFRASAPEQIEVALDLANGLPAVKADVTQLQQLVMNLVINGVESLGDNSGTVRVSTSTMDVDEGFLRSADLVEDLSPGHYVLIEVSDTGCGMDADTRARIFDPFFTTKFTGRGLGLAAAAGIVRAHQGGMKVHSVPGQGSIFQIFLPAVPAEIPEASSPLPTSAALAA